MEDRQAVELCAHVRERERGALGELLGLDRLAAGGRTEGSECEPLLGAVEPGVGRGELGGQRGDAYGVGWHLGSSLSEYSTQLGVRRAPEPNV